VRESAAGQAARLGGGYRREIYSFVAVAFWNMVGPGLFGILGLMLFCICGLMLGRQWYTEAGKHGIADGDWVTVESRRGSLTVRCQVVTTIRPDVVFVPYHWVGDRSVNLVTIASQDPVSKIPEYKVCAVRLRKSGEPAYARRLEPQQ